MTIRLAFIALPINFLCTFTFSFLTSKNDLLLLMLHTLMNFVDHVGLSVHTCLYSQELIYRLD